MVRTPIPLRTSYAVRGTVLCHAQYSLGVSAYASPMPWACGLKSCVLNANSTSGRRQARLSWRGIASRTTQ
eukprot:2777103-Rhodomonas_salina.1